MPRTFFHNAFKLQESRFKLNGRNNIPVGNNSLIVVSSTKRSSGLPLSGVAKLPSIWDSLIRLLH